MENSIDKILYVNGGITAPKGFLASGIPAGIKKNGNSDIALVFSEKASRAAGIFTLNKIRGHSLVLCEKNIEDGNARCIFINSGNANACLGPSGFNDALLISEQCSLLLKIPASEILTGSTGVIGHPLPMDKILPGIKKAYSQLKPTGGNAAAKAIMTTDTYAKEAAVSFLINNKTITIGGMAKGSGMIHPNMATLIGVLTTDANIPAEFLKIILKKTADKSFNRISIDGDTSVCDKILILANGMSETPEIKPGTKEAELFILALESISIKLSKMIAADGEGSTKLIEINIKNAISENDAHLAAKAISNSLLVKTAFFGEDANWGRILTAIGYSGADFDPLKTSISIEPLLLYSNGIAIPFNEEEAKVILCRKDIYITVDFGTGKFNTTVWTCDLSHAYIDINAKYRT